jgi:prevent-host-death family protein
MREMSSSEFKAKCLAVIDEVGESGDRVVISKRGKRVAELIRYTGVEEGSPQATLRGTAHVDGDIVGHTVDPETWRSIDRR